MRNFFLLIVAILLASCNANETTNECLECSNSEFSLKQFNINKSVLNFKEYKTNKNALGEFYSLNSTTKEIENFARILTDYNFNNLDGLVFFVDEDFNSQIIEKNKIKSFVAYLKEGDKYLVKIFENKNGIFIENKNSNFHSNIISTNDFYNISKLLKGDIYRKTFSIINFKTIPKNKYVGELQDIVKELLIKKSLYSSRYDYSSNYGCQAPCLSGEEALCTAQESQSGGESWFCIPDPKICGESKNEAVISARQSAKDSKKFNFKEIRVKLYKFRDDYLLKKGNGKKYVDLYYDLSKKAQYSRLAYEDGVETFTIIEEVLPSLESLVVSPESTEIVPINEETAIILKDYLLNSSDLFEGGQSQEEINYLMMKVDEFTNKSNYYITTHL